MDYIALANSLCRSSAFCKNLVSWAQNGQLTGDVTLVIDRATQVSSLLEMIGTLMSGGGLKRKDLSRSFLAKCSKLDEILGNGPVPTTVAQVNSLLTEILDFEDDLRSSIILVALGRLADQASSTTESLEYIRAISIKAAETSKKLDKTCKAVSAKEDRIRSLTAVIEEMNEQSNLAFTNTQKKTTIIEGLLEKIREFAKDARSNRDSTQRNASYSLEMKKAAEEIVESLANLSRQESMMAEAAAASREEAEADLKEIRDRARKILFEATTAALAQEWSKRCKAAQNSSFFWAAALGLSTVLALLASVFVAVPQLFSPFLSQQLIEKLSTPTGTLEHQILTKSFVYPPLVFSIWFCAAQYKHARDRQMEMSKREAVAKTLEAYHNYLKSLAPADPAWQASVLELFKNSVQKMYDFLLSPEQMEAPTHFSIFNKRATSVQEIASDAKSTAALVNMTK